MSSSTGRHPPFSLHIFDTHCTKKEVTYQNLKVENWFPADCILCDFLFFMGGTFGSPEELKERGYNQFCAKLFCPGFSTTWKLVTMQVLPWVNRHSHWDHGKHEKPQNSKLKLLLNSLNIPCLDYVGVLTLSCLTFSGFNLAIKRPHSRR